jgi:membrane fusion protein (multidrug efflux system)
MRTPRNSVLPDARRPPPVRRGFWALGLVLLGWLAACGAEVSAAKAGPGGPVPVGVLTLAPQAVTLTRELPGRTTAYRVSEVRARVTGIVQSREFKEGSDVKEGDLLFEIDAQPYQASLAGSRATLARAEANLAAAKLQATRVAALAADNVASLEEQDRTRAALEAAQADADAARASVKTARITVGYTKVTAPISGRIGRSEVTEGAFVQQTAANLMATIQQLDPIYVDLVQPTAELLRLRRSADGSPQTGPTRVTLLLEDGRVYDEPGTLQFSDVTVDESTGSIQLRALFPNPRGELLPGMFVRARLEEATVPQALLVPQRAVSRDPKGQAFALVVNAEKKVEKRLLVTDRVVGDAWLVTEGLAAGEQVIVDGLQKVRPGVEVVPTPAEPAPAPAKAAPSPTK